MSNLLRAWREIGLLSNVGFARVGLIRYMRDHASAAHPNQVQLSGLQLASWLETSIRDVITLPPDWIAARTGRLLANIKAQAMDAAVVAATASFFEELPGDRADTIAAGLFGLYTDPSAPPSWLTTCGSCGRSSGLSSARTRGTASGSSTVDTSPASRPTGRRPRANSLISSAVI